MVVTIYHPGTQTIGDEEWHNAQTSSELNDVRALPTCLCSRFYIRGAGFGSGKEYSIKHSLSELGEET